MNVFATPFLGCIICSHYSVLVLVCAVAASSNLQKILKVLHKLAQSSACYLAPAQLGFFHALVAAVVLLLFHILNFIFSILFGNRLLHAFVSLSAKIMITFIKIPLAAAIPLRCSFITSQ